MPTSGLIGLRRGLGAALFAWTCSAWADTPPVQPAADSANLTTDDEYFLQLADQTEVVEVWGERPNKPFDRDTTLRLTQRDLRRRGIDNVAQALEELPEINVRAVARGGRQIDIRGARKGSLKVLIDGVPISDPYRGNVDLSAIPVTDIVEIRVSAAPTSPIDGTGGPGGLVEIHTKDAVGSRELGVRTDVNSLPQAFASATARSMLSDHWGLRLSTTGNLGRRDLEIVMPDGTSDALDEDRDYLNVNGRVEYQRGPRRLAIDASGGRGGYVAPPSATEVSPVISVDADDRARLGLSADDEFGGFRLQARSYAASSRRRSRFFSDTLMNEVQADEDIDATSLGATILANRPFLDDELQWVSSAAVDRDAGDIRDSGEASGGSATLGALASGFKFDGGKVRADGALGVAVPLDIDANPWPEAKLTVKVRPTRPLDVRVTTGLKGRLPTLQERFSPTEGNEGLGPEQVFYTEIGVAAARNHWVNGDVAAYVRRTSGMIRFDNEAMTLTNVGIVSVRGLDARATIAQDQPVHAGASVSLMSVDAGENGDDWIERLANRRAQAWLGADYNDRFGGRARVSYFGTRIDRAQPLPPYWLTDVSGFAQVREDLLVSLRMENVFDNRYLDRIDGFLGVGRVFMVSLQADWR